MKAKSKADKTEDSSTKKRGKYLSQSDVPKHSFAKALEVARAIQDNYAGHPTTPLQVAKAMDISPTSSNWQELPGSSLAYGLTTGSYNAQLIGLTDLGKRIVAPTEEGDDEKAIVEAIQKPRILKEFFTKYNRAKFPKDSIAINVLVEMGVPNNKAQGVLAIVKENGKYAGILQEVKGNTYVSIETAKPSLDIDTAGDSKSKPDTFGNGNEDIPDELAAKLGLNTKTEKGAPPELPKNEKPTVFISHGRNKKIVEQIKEILKFGQFETIVSVEKESTAIPVPEKVFADMRKCDAAVIHIESEEELLDKEGNKHLKINENVLIEIGAAMALYDKRFVLLCEKSIKLPSNLQGLYRCNYEGQQLDYDATMKLLKAFNEFR